MIVLNFLGEEKSVRHPSFQQFDLSIVLNSYIYLMYMNLYQRLGEIYSFFSVLSWTFVQKELLLGHLKLLSYNGTPLPPCTMA